MTDTTTLKDDLEFVADAVRDKPNRGVPSIYLLWAGIIAVGFSLPDFVPEYASVYWAVAAPAGAVMSFLLGARAARRYGKRNNGDAARHGWHWGVAVAAFFLAGLMALTRQGHGELLGLQILLLVTVSYALAAVHLDRPLWVPAALMAAGYVVLVVLNPPFGWTATGMLIATSLATTAYRAHVKD